MSRVATCQASWAAPTMRASHATMPTPAARNDAAKRIVANALSEGRAWLDPIEISELFAAYAIPMVPTFAVATAEEAVVRAEPFLAQGHSIAVKILSRDITHKSDVGGVMLRLATREAVAMLPPR